MTLFRVRCNSLPAVGCFAQTWNNEPASASRSGQIPEPTVQSGWKKIFVLLFWSSLGVWTSRDFYFFARETIFIG